MEPRTRQELATMFDWAMARPQVHGPNKRRRPTIVKSYIIESTTGEHGSSNQAIEIVTKTLTELNLFEANSFTVRAAEENTLVSIGGRIGKERLEAHIDFTNPRYWLVHSISDADALDWLTARWTDNAPEVDRAWFPISLLSNFQQLGHLTGVSLFFDGSNLRLKRDAAQERVNESLKMRFSGTQAEKVLRTVQSEGSGCEHQAALSSVRLKGGNDATKLSSEIRHDGRITARGNSFAEHIFIVTSVLRAYRELIRLLEDEFALRTKIADDAVTIAGRPVCIKLPVPILDVKQFCDGVFSCMAPFRLFGIPIQITDKYYYVQAIDMHSSGLLRFEVLPDLIRVYLLNGTCGNAVLRFITNLQHSLDARIETDFLSQQRQASNEFQS
jgi:hypothetical protein